MNQPMTIYEAIGGSDKIRALVTAFYKRVSKNETLKPLFPDDFTEIQAKQYAFLTQFFGGPHLYTDEYGHPMMRARHLRFPITHEHKDAWLECMTQAMDEVELDGPLREYMFERLSLTAHHMVNTEEGQTNELGLL